MLLIGVVGAIVLALPERLGERLATISLGHPRGTDMALPEGPSTAAPITRADQQATEALEATARSSWSEIPISTRESGAGSRRG